MPFSSYVVVAKNGLTDIVLRDFTTTDTSSRKVIKTGFAGIQSMIFGLREKILFVADRPSGVVAEYQILESGCPLEETKVVCSSLFFNKDVKCRDENRIWI